jgi:hypothetical protein
MSRIPAAAMLAQVFAAIDHEKGTTPIGFCDEVRDICAETAHEICENNPSRAYLRSTAILIAAKAMRQALDMSE